MKADINKLREIKDQAISMMMGEIKPRYMVNDMEATMKGIKLLADCDELYDDILEDYKKMYDNIAETKLEVETLRRKLEYQNSVLEEIKGMLKEQNSKKS